jgi:hypothetical protein
VFGAHWFLIVHPAPLSLRSQTPLTRARPQLLFLPETRDTVLLIKKARALRAQTGDDRIRAPHEAERAQPGRLWRVALARPVKFLFTEPITAVAAL